MADLVTWLRAQLDEDERLARRPAPGPWRLIGEPRETRVVSPAGPAVAAGWLRDLEHVARHDPARVLREVEAKRKLLAWLDAVDRFMDQDHMAYYRLGGEVDTDEARALLALSYQDRSGRQTAEPPGPRVCQRRDRSRPGPPEPPA